MLCNNTDKDFTKSKFWKDNFRVQERMAKFLFQRDYSFFIWLSRYKYMSKVMIHDIKWDSDINFKAFLTKECVTTITQLWPREQIVCLVWVPLDFSKLRWFFYVCSPMFVLFFFSIIFLFASMFLILFIENRVSTYVVPQYFVNFSIAE